MSVIIDGIVTGDDEDIPLTLTIKKATFTIDPGSVVKAALVTVARTAILIPVVICSESADGADWANSLVIVPFSSAQTLGLSAGKALIEIQVDDGKKTTWFEDVEIFKGTIA